MKPAPCRHGITEPPYRQYQETCGILSAAMQLTVCLPTFNSARLLREVLPPLREIADEFVVLDSGSKDDTLEILRGFGIGATHRPYSTHGEQMNAAVSQAAHDWVLCIDSDEVADDQLVAAVRALKA